MLKMYYLKNVLNGRKVDVISSTLDGAKIKASEMLGGSPKEYVERF